jgi:hypothetical protein
MPNVKETERISKIKTKMTQMIEDKDEAVLYVLEQGCNRKLRSRIINHHHNH